jgi:hypothetical protein
MLTRRSIFGNCLDVGKLMMSSVRDTAAIRSGGRKLDFKRGDVATRAFPICGTWTLKTFMIREYAGEPHQ